MNDDKLVLGRACALIAFIAFIVNGTFFRTEALVAVSGGAGVVALLAISPYWRQFPHFSKMMLLLLAVASILVIIKAYFYVVAYSYLMLVPSAIAISIYIFKYPDLFRIRWVLYGLMAYLFLYVLLGGSPEQAFAGSRNQISVVLIALGSLALAMESRKSDLLLAVLIFVACVLAVGSSGVVASAVLLLATIFQQQQRPALKVLAVAGIAISLIGFEIYLEYYAPREFTAKFSFERLTGTDVRFQIIGDYFERYLTGPFLWLGPPDLYTFYVYSDVASGGSYNYLSSLHNSYLSVHAKTGILSLLVFAIIGAVMYNLRKDPYRLFLMIAILTRAFGDSVFILDGYYNFCLYYFFILASLARDRAKAEWSTGQTARVGYDPRRTRARLT